MQVFHPSMNTVARLTLFGSFGLALFLCWVFGMVYRMPWSSWVGVPRQQPVPFSHKHHVGEGFDCRYCHTSVEESAFAGIPPTKTCMNCHWLIWSGSPILEPVRESYRTGRSLAWTRVNDLGDFVFFNHSIHIAKGFGCSTCHGRVDQMPLTWRGQRLHMSWCTDCHRHPEEQIRPKSEIYDMEYEPPANQLEMGRDLVKKYGIADPQSLINCTTCHR